MRKLIGTIAIIIVLYFGFFCSEKYNVKPFIQNCLNSEQSSEVKKNVKKVGSKVLNKAKENSKELTDTTINQIKNDTI